MVYSACRLFVQHGAITFMTIVRKQQLSLLHSLFVCNHAILRDFVCADRFCVLLYLRNGVEIFVCLSVRLSSAFILLLCCLDHDQ